MTILLDIGVPFDSSDSPSSSDNNEDGFFLELDEDNNLEEDFFGPIDGSGDLNGGDMEVITQYEVPMLHNGDP